MLPGWAVIIAALVYLCCLFAIARIGDKIGRRLVTGRRRSVIYALTIGVYCTSWTFLGSVGLASRSGIDFFAIYVGPLAVFLFGGGLLRRILRLAKAQNITSVADFVASRFGKNQSVAAAVALIAVIGVVPYIALQLKAISASLAIFVRGGAAFGQNDPALFEDPALALTLMLAVFAAAFGTRHVDATEHQDGLMVAIATESVVKLVTFLSLGVFVTFFMFDGPADILERAAATMTDHAPLLRGGGPASFLTMALLSGFAIILLPRQFHVTVVENRDEADLKAAARLFPAYLVAINLFVVPIALAGLILIPDAGFDRDMTVLTLPIVAATPVMTMAALIGGLSAATAMVIVESIALAIMVSNDLVMPLILHRRVRFITRHLSADMDMGALLLLTRRIAILFILLCAYAYDRAAGDATLSAIGLLSFAAIAQIAPVFLGGLVWKNGTARGVLVGLALGIALWAYTLLLPSIAAPDTVLMQIVEAGPFGLRFLRPTAMFGLHLPLIVHGTLISLLFNTLGFVLASRSRDPTPIERLQANLFVLPERAAGAPNFRLWRGAVSIEDVKTTVARYLGNERTQQAFAHFAQSRGLRGEAREADIQTLRFAEHLLSSAIGAASSRLVLSLLLRRRNVSTRDALKLLDDASAVFQQSRDLLQHALDHAGQAVTVYDRDMRLSAWNRAFQDIFDIPSELLQVGVGIGQIIRSNAERGIYGAGDVETIVAARLAAFAHSTAPMRLRLHPGERAIEVRSNRLPDGGFVTTYTDITLTVRAEEELERARQTLERRVRERTEELTTVNAELAKAKAQADEANLSKTRFLAAASHDILQPLNAARLYTSALVERADLGGDLPLARNIDASLEAVEEILTTLLDISRLDSGVMTPEWSVLRVDDIFRQLQLEFAPAAGACGLELVFVPCSASIRSDRRLLRRLLQNLISNALKYTPRGKVLVGARRRRAGLRLIVADTGIGIPAAKQRLIFREFQRLEQHAGSARGLGLGLSIVERLGKLLDHRIGVQSTPGRGSLFSVDVPLARVAAPAARAEPEPALDIDPMLAGALVVAIDNEPAILEGMQVLLSGWGCAVLTARDARDALAQLRAKKARPFAVVADYHLDRSNGLDEIVRLRRRFQNLRAILMTADRSPQVRERAADLSVLVLNKPMKPAALRATLAQWRRADSLVAAE